MGVVTLNPSADTMLISDGATTNYGTNPEIQVGELVGYTSTRNSLVKFDLSSYMGKTCTAAVLRLYETGADYTNNERSLTVRNSARAWTELGATWNKYDGTNNWASGGGVGAGDYLADGLYVFKTMGASPSTGYVDIDLNVTMINELLDGTYTNNGMILYNQAGGDDAHIFYSRDNGSNMPELVLTFPDANSFLIMF